MQHELISRAPAGVSDAMPSSVMSFQYVFSSSAVDEGPEQPCASTETNLSTMSVGRGPSPSMGISFSTRPCTVASIGAPAIAFAVE